MRRSDVRRAARSGPFPVAIVGGSGSGKTWLAGRLKRKLGRKALHISLDDFYRDRSGMPIHKRERINFDHPAAIDWPPFRRVLSALVCGREASLPVYDFNTHCRHRRPRRLKPRPILLVDGLWLLRSPSLRRLFPLRVFLRCCRATRMTRRLARDLQFRGRTRQSILKQFRTTVQPMHTRFVETQKKQANIVLPEEISEKDIQHLAQMIEQRLSSRP